MNYVPGWLFFWWRFNVNVEFRPFRECQNCDLLKSVSTCIIFKHKLWPNVRKLQRTLNKTLIQMLPLTEILFFFSLSLWWPKSSAGPEPPWSHERPEGVDSQVLTVPSIVHRAAHVSIALHYPHITVCSCFCFQIVLSLNFGYFLTSAADPLVQPLCSFFWVNLGFMSQLWLVFPANPFHLLYISQKFLRVSFPLMKSYLINGTALD